MISSENRFPTFRDHASAANLRFLSFVEASSFRNLKFKSRTRFIELLVVLRFRSSYRNMPRALTNFGIGPLGCSYEPLGGDRLAIAQRHESQHEQVFDPGDGLRGQRLTFRAHRVADVRNRSHAVAQAQDLGG